jgi:DNA invertase Pin-like site-specific DNA recombinase
VGTHVSATDEVAYLGNRLTVDNPFAAAHSDRAQSGPQVPIPNPFQAVDDHAGRVMEAMRAGQVERIVVWRLDRLGRTTKGLCQLFDELTERKVDLVSLKDGFSLASPAGRLHARILASVAEYETEVRAERVAAGQAVARRKGKRWGGSQKGWRWKVTTDQIAAIHEMRTAGKPVTQIARVTGLSRPTVYHVLRSPMSASEV